MNNSFTNVANKVLAARAQTSVYPSTYPISGANVNKSRPEWFHAPYTNTTAIDNSLTVKETGDVAHRNPILSSDLPVDVGQADSIADLEQRVQTIEQSNP